ncbi:MAG: protein kinase domain-containing protein [Pirellulaceae bacterium]
MSLESGAEFLDLLEKSRLLDEATLQELRQKYGNVEDARALARKLVDKKILTDWQSRYLLSGRHRLMIGQYQLLERFSRQTMGDRFLGRHRQLDRQVDVYLFPADAADNQELFKKFLEQASRVANLDHPHLFHLYDIDQESGRYYIVFEHDDGDSLKNAPRGSFDIRKIADVMEQSLGAIQYAHSHGILHGKLDETQIRVDNKDQACIRNIGLGDMLDRLHEARNEQDEFAVTPQPSDDAVALGRIGQYLLERHVGEGLTDQDKELGQLMKRLASCHGEVSSALEATRNSLRQWIQQYDAANVPAKQGDKPVQATTTPAKPITRQAAPKSRASASAKTQKNRTPAIAALAVTLLLALVGGGYLVLGMLGNGDEDQQARTESSTADASKNDVGSKKSTPSDDAPSSIDDAAQRFDSTNDASTPSPQSADTADPKSDSLETTSAESEVDYGETPAEAESRPDNDPVDQEPVSQKPETTTSEPASDVSFPGAEGLPLVEWSNAESMVGKEAVVFGQIRSVGQSGPFRFMNFTARRSKSISIVIDSREYDISADQLRKTYDEQNILVRGTVEMYERNQTPQIVVTGPDQLRLIDELPQAGQMVSSGNNSSGAGRDGNAVAPSGSGTFDLLGNSLAVPSLDRINPNYEKTLLGKLQIGDSPLGMFLTVPDEAASRPVSFELQRDEATKKRWDVIYAPSSRNDAGPGQTVGQFLLEGDELYFQWLERAELDAAVNALRNCLVELKTPDVSKTLILRAPVQLPAIVLDSKKPQYRERLDIQNLPVAESISVQIVELPKEEFEVQVTQDSYNLNVDQPELSVFFNTIEEQMFFRLHHAVDISGTIKLESALEINSPDAPLYNRASLRRLNDFVYSEQARLSQLNQEAQAWQAPDGQKRDHNRRKKEISAQLEIVNAQVEAFEAAKPVVERLLDRELHYRVFFTVNGIEFDLAVSGAAADTDADDADAEN